MDKLVKLKTDCMRQLSYNKEDERKFRLGVGFIGFITSSKDKNKTTLEIFRELHDRAYYKRNDVEVLLYIFHIMEITECKKLVEKYKKDMNLGPSVPTASAPLPTHSLTEKIGDEALFGIRNKIPIGNLQDFAVRGLGMSFVEFENITAGHKPYDKILNVLKEWGQKAPLDPIDGGASNMVPYFTYGGLKLALERAELRAVISDLGLHNMNLA